jgi:hypothetical protein
VRGAKQVKKPFTTIFSIIKKHMKRTFFLFGAILCVMILTFPPGCYYDNEVDLYGTGTPCDTANVSYASYIQPLLQDHCYKCHKESEPEFSGYILDGYSHAQDYALSGKMADRTNNAGNPMPPLSEGGLLPDCDRQKILSWIRAGAPQN